MANIKVTYGSIVRRLTISSTTTWSELENQLHNLFDIPQEISIAVTYTDEDDDVITLSSDLELQEVLSNNLDSTIKFVLITLNVNVNNLNNRERSIDTVVDEEEETSNLIDGISAIQIEESNNQNKHDDITSSFRHVTITDEIDDPLFNQQQETSGESSKRAAESINVQETNLSEGNQENSDDEHEIIVIITRNPWSHRRRARFGGRNPYYPCRNNFGGRFRYGCHSGGYDRSTFSRGHRCGRYYRRHQQISSEDVAEKINILHSMGFFNDNLEELVKNYNGNLEFVIEVLLLNQQNEQNNEIGKEEVVRKENGEDQTPMEVEEESRPYNL